MWVFAALTAEQPWQQQRQQGRGAAHAEACWSTFTSLSSLVNVLLEFSRIADLIIECFTAPYSMQLAVDVQIPAAFGGIGGKAVYIGGCMVAILGRGRVRRRVWLQASGKGEGGSCNRLASSILSCRQQTPPCCHHHRGKSSAFTEPRMPAPVAAVAWRRLPLVVPFRADTEGSFMADRAEEIAAATVHHVKLMAQRRPQLAAEVRTELPFSLNTTRSLSTQKGTPRPLLRL